MLFITNRFPTLVAVVFFPFSPCEPFFFYSTSFTCMSKRFNIHYNKNNHVTKDKNYRISTGNKIFRANTALDWALSSDCYIRTSIFREKLFEFENWVLVLENWFQFQIKILESQKKSSLCSKIASFRKNWNWQDTVTAFLSSFFIHLIDTRHTVCIWVRLKIYHKW